MHFSTLCVLLVGSLSYALPTAEDINVAQLALTNRVISKPVGPKIHGARAMAKTRAKYGVLDPTRSKDLASTTTQTGTVSGITVIPDDEEYLFPVTVGTNELMINFDVGSADFWVFSTELSKKESQGHKLYHPKISGKKLKHLKWAIVYVDISGASGNVWRDNITIGNLSPFQQRVEAANHVTPGIQEDYFDGLMGFGFQSENTCYNERTLHDQLCPTPFENIQPTLPSPIFTATLRDKAPGTWDFGFIDPSLYTGDITTVSLTNQTKRGIASGAWKILLGGYSIGQGPKIGYNRVSVVDTGSSMAYIKQSILKKYYKHVPSAVYDSSSLAWTYNCTDGDKLPDFSFYFDGEKRTAPGAFLNYGPSDNDGNCYGGLQPDNAFGFSIIGDPFLKSQYVVFNPAERTIGFAQQAGVEV